jgi:putative Mg2+ transporter-C (MgtC) family protein
MEQWGIYVAQLLIAVVCGGIIGYQRETLERPAGFRTHVLVCVGSTIYMMVSVLVGGKSDPGRIAAQVASGIGFLGAGTIIKQGSVVRGLTTAASLWAVAGIGLAAGMGKAGIPIAVLGTIVVLLSLGFLKRFESHIERQHNFSIQLTAADSEMHIEWIRTTLQAHNVEMGGLSVVEGDDGVDTITLEAHTRTYEDIERAVSALARGNAIKGVRWQGR